jgi:hypothetical protein
LFCLSPEEGGGGGGLEKGGRREKENGEREKGGGEGRGTHLGTEEDEVVSAFTTMDDLITPSSVKLMKEINK